MADRAQRAGARAWRTIAVLGGGLALLWITMAATWAQVAAPFDPARALLVWPIAAGARARLAETRLTVDASPAAIAANRSDAVRVLLREPVNVVAARVAGLSAGLAGDDRGARRALVYAERLSRRDLGTQLAWIELSVAAGDIPDALRHYDTALRTSEGAKLLLLPVLVSASQDEKVATAVGALLLRRPPWRERFVSAMTGTKPWGPTFVPLMIAARLDTGNPQERELLTTASKGLAADGAIGDAARLVSAATRTRVGHAVRNGDFAIDDGIVPFDWDIVDEHGLGASRGAVNGAPRGALSLRADPGRSGMVAKQALLLAPGRYQLSFRAGQVGAADQSSLSLACGASRAVLTEIRLPATSSRPRRAQVMVDIPPGCDSQWLQIQAGTDIDASSGDQSPWLSDISLVRMTADRGMAS